MEISRTAGGAAAIYHHDNKTQLCHRLQPQRRAEGLWDKEPLRARIDELDDGIFLRGIKIRRAPDQSVESGRTVRSFPLKRFRELPSCFQQRTRIRLFE